MSSAESSASPSAGMLAAGTVIFVVTLGAWLTGEWIGRDTSVVWVFATPIVAALFLAQPISTAARAASAAERQTNGVLRERIQAAVADALANRDAARTRQHVGDVSEAGQAIEPSEAVETMTAAYTPKPAE